MARYLYYDKERPSFLSDCLVQSKAAPNHVKVSDDEVLPPLDQIIVREGKVYHQDKVPPGKRRVAMISDYGINCGIATYTEYLCNAMRPLVAELKIFAEDTSKGDVVKCWDRKGDYLRIIPELQKFQPDLVFIQHEFGLFHQAGAWNTLMSQLSRWRTVVVFHTVLEHRVDHLTTHLDYLTRSLSEAACPEIIVHTPKARETLRARGYSGRLHYIPHGCFPPNRKPKLPATKYKMFPEHSIFQYGFGGVHKGWDIAIDVVGLLKKKYPDVIYVGMFNLSAQDESAQRAYHKKLLDKIAERGLSKNVAIHAGYQSEEMLSNFIRSSRVALFPYQVPNPHWKSWGASGAIQLPLSHGIPMVLSNFPCFMEFAGRLPTCASAQEMAGVIDRIFSDPAYEKQMSEMSYAISEERRWEKAAQWYLDCKPSEDFNAL